MQIRSVKLLSDSWSVPNGLAAVPFVISIMSVPVDYTQLKVGDMVTM